MDSEEADTVIHLFSAWQELVTRLDQATSVILLSDFDGTLTPIVDRPELAWLSERTRGLLQSLVKGGRYTVGIISGRALDDLRDRVGLEEVLYAGNYGLEIEAPWLRFVQPAAQQSKPLLDSLYRELVLALEGMNGAILENKRLSFSVHYRLVEERQIDTLKTIVERVTHDAVTHRVVKVACGKKVYEIAPAVAWHKGKVVDLLIERHPQSGETGTVLPLFLGDDLSDEEGFRAVEKHNGVSVFVGEANSQSHALYFLSTPDEVDEFLARLARCRIRGGGL